MWLKWQHRQWARQIARKRMIAEWGPEVVLRCECRDVPSHLMDGRRPQCPSCRGVMEILVGESWEEIKQRNKR